MSRVVRAELDELELTLREPFVTSFGTEHRRRFLLLRLFGTSGAAGWGECVAAGEPLYSPETIETARWVLGRLLIPTILATASVDPSSFERQVRRWKGHQMAKAAVEMALWDLAAQEQDRSLSHALGGRKRRVEVGVSVGIQRDIPTLLRVVGRHVEDGYRRVKLKVRPGWDARPIRAVRRAHPDLRLWIDANQAYSPRERVRLASIAHRNELELVEQPFGERSIRAHADLQQGVRFRVCLDESISDEASLDDAISAKALQSLNIKPGRVGGHGVSLRLARRARRFGIEPWVGGMLESGVGRAHNLALSSTSAFRFPPDLSASDRYYTHDLLEVPFRLDSDGCLEVPTGPGLGRTIDPRVYRRSLRRTDRFPR